MDFSQMDLKWQAMRAGIEAQAAFVRQSPPVVYEQIRQRLALTRVPSRVYLVGCGDSWYCGLCTRLAFEVWAGVHTDALEALEFSRYEAPFGPVDALVVAISNSGRVARTIEAVRQGRRLGMKTVAGTGALQSPIAQAAEVALDLSYAERRFAPGTSSYLASLMLQYCIALYLAEVGGRMTTTQVQGKLGEISALGDGLSRSIAAQTPIFEVLGAQAHLEDRFVFIGGGPNYGTACFSQAKLIEAARRPAMGQELEEWAHIQFFVTGPQTYTFVIAPPGASLDRAREQIWAANEMGSTTVALCDAEDGETAALAKIAVPVYGGRDEFLSPLIYCLPGELFALSFAVDKQLTMLGFDDPHVKAVNFRQIFGHEEA